MKRAIILGGIIIALFKFTATTQAAEIIDAKTVYSPGINVCVSSFGGLIQSSEIIVQADARYRTEVLKELILHWINESNSAGFYLQEYDTSLFHWQLVETKKYAGVVLIVTGDKIQENFYQSLGGGLNIEGRDFYGLRTPKSINGDIYSFVFNKETSSINHFENWRFTEESDHPVKMTKMQTRSLLTKKQNAVFCEDTFSMKNALRKFNTGRFQINESIDQKGIVQLVLPDSVRSGEISLADLIVV